MTIKICVSYFCPSWLVRRVLSGGLAVAVLAGGLLPDALLPEAKAGTYELGLEMYQEGRYDMAVRYFREATEQNALDVNAHYYLADSYLKLSRLGEAQAEYRKILAMAPDSQAARLSRVGLSRLMGYLDSTNSKRWRRAGGSGSGKGLDRYTGTPPNGEDYLDEVSENGKFVRWALTKMPLRLYIEQSPQGIRNFQPAFVNQIRLAMDVWVKALEHQLSYTIVYDKEEADIAVSWINSIDTRGHETDGGTAYTAGLTLPRIRNDELWDMDVKIATFDIQGKPQKTEIIYAVAIHELGHALGLLGHSDSSEDIMYAQNQNVTMPSRRDINTIRKLYMAVADISNVPMAEREENNKQDGEAAKRLDQSIAKMEEQAKQDGMALTWLNLSVAYFQKAKNLMQTDGPAAAKLWYEKSMKAINQAIALEPEDPRAYHKRSLVYQELQNYESALADIQKSISLDRKEPEYYLLQSWYLASLGRTAQARSSLDTYLLYKPGEAGSTEVKRVQERLSQGR